MIDFELYVKTCKVLRDSIQSWNESQKQQATLADAIAHHRCRNAIKKRADKIPAINLGTSNRSRKGQTDRDRLSRSRNLFSLEVKIIKK